MKNLMIYINPRKGWEEDYNTPSLVELQLDCSLDFWQPEDILFITNFPYEYRGVKTVLVPDNLFCRHDRKATKINTVIHLIEQKMVDGLTWFHDIDAFPLRPFDVVISKDAGFTNGGYTRKWNTGSFFFKPTALDIFQWIQKTMYEIRRGEEPALLTLTDADYNNINSRYDLIDNAYNVGMTKTHKVLKKASRPIRVVHFPPHWPGVIERYQDTLTDTFVQRVSERFGEKHD